MSGTKGNVIHLQEWDPQHALERLNRLTGLRFARWPESLVQRVSPVGVVEQDGSDFAILAPTGSTVAQR